VIVELNLSHSPELEGLHDIYIPAKRPSRTPIPVVACDIRVGSPYIPVDPDKIAAIVITEKQDSAARISPPDAETNSIAGHLIGFFRTRCARVGST
jgi:succinyl-CoA:acetate CoA-transferase